MYDGDMDDNCESPQAEVRMIDFAHTQVKGGKGNSHIGPDRGYIMGVTSLINVFTQLLEKLSV